MSDTLRVSNLFFGTNATNYNQPQMGYTSVGIGTTTNYGFLQFFGTSNTLCWTANGTVGIGTTNPTQALQVYGNIYMGAGYRNFSLVGGNANGYLYGCFTKYGDGIHLGYNFYNDNTTNYVSNVGGATSRISLGYGFVAIYTGAVNTEPTTLGYYQGSTGNVGIGTNAPTAGLHIKNATSAMRITCNVGNASNRPAVSTTPGAYEIRSSSSGGDWGDDGFLRLSAGGGTGTTTQSYIDLSGYSTVSDMNQNIILGTSGAERMRIDRSGNVGIGIANPTCPLDVGTTSTGYSIGAGYFLTYNSSTLVYSGGTTNNISIRANQCMLAVAYFAASDQRIKSNIVPVTDSLAKLDVLSIVQYDKIDYKEKGADVGVIAQNVQSILPRAITVSTKIIPNIYQCGVHALEGEYVRITVMVLSPNSKGKIRLHIGRTEIEELYEEELLHLQDNHFDIKPWKEYSSSDTVFVYGTEVDDFLSVDKEQIGILAAGGVKELHQQVLQQQQTIATQQQQLTELQTQLATLEARLAAAGI